MFVMKLIHGPNHSVEVSTYECITAAILNGSCSENRGNEHRVAINNRRGFRETSFHSELPITGFLWVYTSDWLL